MDVRLFVHGLPALSPYLLAEVQERVHQRCRNACEAQSVADSECSREEERAVRMILLEIDGRIVVQDTRNIVRSTSIVE